MTKRNTPSTLKTEGMCCPHCSRVIPQIIIKEENGDLLVWSPKVRAANFEWRKIHGRQFDRDQQCNRVSKAAFEQVKFLLYKFYDGVQAMAPDGSIVTINQAWTQAKAA